VTTTANAFSQTGPGSFVTVLDTTGSGLMYSSYIAAGASKGYGIAVDNSGNTYITGSVNITSPLPTTAGAFQSTHAGQISDAFVAKFNPNLSGAASLVYSTYLGGPNSPSSASYGFDTGVDIAVDASGNAYVLGHTGSTAFPTTAGAFQRSYGGTVDLFIAKINPVLSGTASLVYSTYLGGKHWDYAGGIAVDSSGNAYVTGDTWSSNFPATRGAYLTKAGFLPFPETGPTAFVTKVNPAGTDLVYSTFLAKVMKSPFGKTYTGTSNWTYSTLGTDIAVDASGAAYLTGRTASASFPVVNPIQSSRAGITDAFITKLNATGSGLLFSTYLGGSGDTDMGTGIAVVGSNTIYVLGATDSTNFPVTAGALQTTNDTGGVVGFLSKITL
jgi:hypothetical protein